jgi:hypothetical protein
MRTFKKLATAAAVFATMSLVIGGAACLIAGAPVWLGVVVVAAYWLI